MSLANRSELPRESVEAYTISHSHDEKDEVLVDQASITTDSVKDYMRKAGRIKLLNAEEEVTIAQQMEVGALAAERRVLQADTLSPEADRELAYLEQQGKQAWRHMIEANLRLVLSLAGRYTGSGLPFVDLIQEGNEGLMRATHKFDYQKGFKFSTYATWWVRQAMMRAIANDGRSIRIPVHAVEKINKIRRAQSTLTLSFGRLPTNQELAEEVRLSPEEVVDLLVTARPVMSLNQPIGSEGNTELADLLPDTASQPMDTDIIGDARRVFLDKLLGSLDDKQAKIIRLRYGIDTERPYTQDEIAAELYMIRQTVQQIEKRAMQKLRLKFADDSQFRDFLS